MGIGQSMFVWFPFPANPACEEVGCGKWEPPMIQNPKYKGKWKPPLIDNPDYMVSETIVRKSLCYKQFLHTLTGIYCSMVDIWGLVYCSYSSVWIWASCMCAWGMYRPIQCTCIESDCKLHNAALINTRSLPCILNMWHCSMVGIIWSYIYTCML